MKTKSKYILLVFVGIIIMLLGGIFFTAQQEKEGPITAEASGPVYWLSEGSSLSTTSCLLCGQSVSASSGTSVAWQSNGTCSMDYYHWGPRGARICYAPITVHNGHFSKMNPTCTTDGYTVTECTRCVEEKDRTVLPALGHDYGDFDIVMVEVTCTSPGYLQAQCSRCSARQTKTVPELGHSYDNYVYNNDATCTEDGTETGKCIRCDDTDTRTKAGTALGHDFSGPTTVIKEPTCTEFGSYEKSCLRCGAKFGGPIPQLGHDWSEEWTSNGTSHWHDCTRCDAKNEEANHVPGAPVRENEVDATCTVAGSYDEVVYCSVCGDELSRETKTITAPGHDYGNWRTTRYPTCTSSGRRERTCSICDDVDTESISAYGHSMSSSYVAATCTSQGYTLKTCTRCSYSYKTNYTSALGHNFATYTTTKQPTCTAAGLETSKCTRCSETNTREIEALGHDYVYHDAKAPTCTEKGWAAYETCSRAGCDYSTYRELLPTAHTPGEAATCTTAQTCSVCGTELVAPLGHKTTSYLGQDATCTEGGWKPYETCTRAGCNYTTYEAISALGHSFTNYISNNDATCTADGTETAECGRGCGETDTRTDTDSALGHTEGEAVRENEVAATCTVAGSYDEVVYCTVCETELSREKKDIPALGHDLEEHEAKAATCTEIGWAAYETCSRCDYTTYEEIPATGHTEGEPVREKEVAATCTAAGSYDEVVYCSVCGDELSRETKSISALGHSFTSYVSNNDATCTADGTETAECDRGCGETDTRKDEGSALGHDWKSEWTSDDSSHWHECTRCDAKGEETDHVPGAAATCTTNQTCSVCGYVIKTALGHTEGEAVRENEVAATCTAAGSYDEVVYCSVCSDELSRETKSISALGHSFTSYVSNNDATCTDDGTETAKCDRCEETDTRTDEGSALGHDWGEEWTSNGTSHWHDCTRCDAKNEEAAHVPGTEATCTTDQTCSVCGYVIKTALGHTEGEPVRENEVDATCTVAGSYDEVVYCSVCGDELSRETKTIPALGHSFTSYVSNNDATCTDDGTETAKCDRCEETDTRTDEGSALGHDWGEEWTSNGTSHWHDCTRCDAKNEEAAHVPGTEATCTTDQTCTVCGYVIEEALGHTEGEAVRENEVAATCTVAGSYDEVVYCTVCETELSREKKDIPALGHDIVEHAGKEPTCTEKGWAAYETCSRAGCDYSTYRELLPTAHTPGEAATCATAQTCSVCGTELVAPLGHNIISHLGQESTCTEVGWNAYETCTRCDYTTYEEIPATGHTEGEAVRENEVAATCTAAGSYDEVVYCTVCETELSREKKDVPALDHSFTDYVSNNDATCTADGTETAECDRGCGETDTRTDTDSALGHNFVDGYCAICGVIDDRTIDGEKDEAKTDLDEIGQEMKDEIDASDLPEDVKEELKDKVDEVIDGAKDNVEGATNFDDIDQAVEDAKDELEDAILDAEKEDSKTDLDEIGQGMKDEIDASDLPEDVKEELKDKVDEVIGGAKEDVDGSTNLDDIDQAVEDAKDELEDAILDAEKEDAKSELDEIAQGAKDEIAASDLPEDVKEELIGKVDQIVNDSKTEIDGEATKEDAAQAVEDAKGELEDAILDAEKDDAKSELDEIAQGAKDEIAASDLPDDVKEELIGKIDQIVNDSKSEIDGATLKEEAEQAVEDAKKEIEEAIAEAGEGEVEEPTLDTEKDEAKTDLDEIGQDMKAEIDASDLPDEVKEELKDKVDEVIDGAKDNVEGSTNFDDIDQAVEDAKDELEDAILDAEKEDAKSELDEIAQGAKDEIAASDLPEDVKEELIGKVDQIVNDSKTEIDGEATKEDAAQAVEDAKGEIEDAILDAEKEDAKSELDEIAQGAKDEIAASDLPEDVKEELIGKVDQIVNDSKTEIDGEATKEDAAQAVEDAKNEIEEAIAEAGEGEVEEPTLDTEKDEAKTDLDEIGQGMKDEIDASDLPEDVKEELKDKVDEVIEEAKGAVDSAATVEEIETALNEAKGELDAVAGELTAEQPSDTRTLWPWLIVAIVISAALSGLFAWRQVKKVHGRGETVGVKSVVTIAVATILIFTVIVGITLLIFVMV